MIRKQRAALLIAAILFSQTACVKDNFDFDKLEETHLSPEIAIPLVYSSLSMSDILSQGNGNTILVDSNHFCTVVYNGRLLSKKAEDFVYIPDQNSYQTVALSLGQINTLNSFGSVSFTITQVLDVAVPNGVEVDSSVFKSGSIDLVINSDFLQGGSIQVTLPDIKRNAVALSQNVPFLFNNGDPFNVNAAPSASFDLTGCAADFTNNGTGHNKIRMVLDITFSGSGTATMANRIFIAPLMNQLKFSSVFGYFGQNQIAPDADTVPISIYNNTYGVGSFSVVNPQIKFTINNSLGLPVQASVSQFEGYTSSQGYYPLSQAGIPNPLPVNSPSVAQMGQTVQTSFVLNNSNSNVFSIVNNNPQQLIYKYDALTNPSGAHVVNFALDTSALSVDMEVNLPLYGSAKDFAFQDTFDFKFENIDKVEALMIRNHVTNGFPVELQLQVYFSDENFVVLDSMLMQDKIIVASAIVNATSGEVISSQKKTTDVTMDAVKINHLKQTKKLIIRATATTSNGGNTNVKIYDFYRFDVQMGALAKMKL